MIAALQQSLAWITAHPTWAMVLFFLAALLDSIFIVGMFVPAGIALFAGGALVALGALELWQAILLATTGAVAGDSFSYWLGRRYGERLFARRFLSRHPEILLNARRFFLRYGAYGVVLARFLGPMRAIVPALAGTSGMRLPVFVAADVGSAFVWAFAFVLPGVVFGASLALAAEVAGRLVLLIGGLLVALSLTLWLTVLCVRAVQNHAEAWIGGMLDWSRRHRRLGKFGMALADPTQPETPVLLLLAVLLLIVSGVWIWLSAGASLHSYPLALDAATFQSLRDLHTPWGLALARYLMALGDWRVYGPVALVTFAALVGLRKPRAAAHWAAALALGAVLSAGLYAIPTLPVPFVFYALPDPPADAPRDLVLATVVYAFLPVLLGSGRPLSVRATLFGGSAAVLLLILWSRLYLGMQWPSVAGFSLLVGILWATLLGLGYRRHRPERLPRGKLLPPVLLVFALSALFAFGRADDGIGIEPSLPQRPTTVIAWQQSLWKDLPQSRIDVAGRSKQAMQLQWAGAVDDIEAQLRAAGWQPLAPLSFGNSLRWLAAESPVEQLAVLPQVHAGHHPALELRLPIDADRELLLRLWRADWQLEDGRSLWLGSVLNLRARQLYRLFRYPAVDPESPAPDCATLPSLLGVDAGAIRQLAPCVLLFSTAASPDLSRGSSPVPSEPSS